LIIVILNEIPESFKYELLDFIMDQMKENYSNLNNKNGFCLQLNPIAPKEACGGVVVGG
jgi:hypothetical protein